MAKKYMLEGNGMKPVGDADDIPEDTPLVQVFAHENSTVTYYRSLTVLSSHKA